MTKSHEYLLLFLLYALIDNGEVNLSKYFHVVWGNNHIDNRSPKGNMWSAIPVALLCMVVNWNERQGSGPEGDEVL